MSKNTIFAPYCQDRVSAFDAIPAALRACDHWVLWRGELRVEKRTGEERLNKIPINPKTGRKASSTKPSTWTTFDQATTALSRFLEQWPHGGGIGFVFTADDSFVGIDLDHCRDPASGAIAEWARHVITRCSSYAEISPSGTGVKIFMRGKLPNGGVSTLPTKLQNCR